ncbi:hypothetical protein [Tianweitania sp.]|uniref:hypothetical protein n=1 Tax=Tianweitania sp. TaxID=2021634 RepID=UPI00289EEF30|nr:hypothetical protein [Tianweitania sp.]
MMRLNSQNAAPVGGIDPSLRNDVLEQKLSRRSALPNAGENVVLHCTQTDRFGLRGPGTMDWLAEQGLAAPGSVNEAVRLPCGTSVLRLGQQEVLLTAPHGDSGERLRALRQAWHDSQLAAKGYDAYREEGWAWFVVTGPNAQDLMRRISMADLRPTVLKVGQVTQTRALHMDVVIARLDHFGAPSYDIFFDIASSEFALEVLTETAEGLKANFEVAALHAPGALHPHD